MKSFKENYFEEFESLVELEKNDDSLSLIEILKITNQLFLEYKNVYMNFYKKLEKSLEKYEYFEYIYDIEVKANSLCIELYLRRSRYDGNYYKYYYDLDSCCLYKIETKEFAPSGKEACEHMSGVVFEMIEYFKANPKMKDSISFYFSLNDFFKGTIFINKISSLSRNYENRFYFNFQIENKIDYNKEKIEYKVVNGNVVFEKKYSPSLTINNFLKEKGEVNILNNIYVKRNRLPLIFGEYYEYVEKYDIDKLISSLNSHNLSFFQKIKKVFFSKEDD